MKPRRLQLEQLEAKQLFAVDGFAAAAEHAPAPHLPQLESEQLLAEGEGDALPPNLVEFARDLTASGTKLFCASWAADCTTQRQLFEDGDQHLPYIEVGTPDRRANSTAAAEGITEVPTWQFPDGSRSVGFQTLEEISTQSGVAIPTGLSPSIANIADQTVLLGSPLHIPVDAYAAAGGSIGIEVTVADPNVLSAEVLTGNRSLRIETPDYGDMVFELFEQRAPRPAARIIELAESGFYEDIIFHRVLDNFVLQAGDPTGTGRGGSALGDFDDQFHLDLQHNAPGILSYAKAGDDTNDSQFFITELPTRHLDFNHSIFGVLTEGENVREAISETAVFSGGRPLFDIPIEAATVFQDNENAVIVLKGLVAGESTDVTITITNEAGHETQHVFKATTDVDTVNLQPFLEPITPVAATENTTASIQLSAIDREGDAVVFKAEALGTQPFDVSVDADGLVRITPPQDFVGTLSVNLSVAAAVSPAGEDSQRVDVEFYSAHHNRDLGLDVNSDGEVSPIDVLVIINFLNSNSGGGSTIGLTPLEGIFRDTNNDRFIAPNDALLVINHLNGRLAGEGEQAGDTHRKSCDTADSLGRDELHAAAIESLLDEQKRRGLAMK